VNAWWRRTPAAGVNFFRTFKIEIDHFTHAGMMRRNTTVPLENHFGSILRGDMGGREGHRFWMLREARTVVAAGMTRDLGLAQRHREKHNVIGGCVIPAEAEPDDAIVFDFFSINTAFARRFAVDFMRGKNYQMLFLAREYVKRVSKRGDDDLAMQSSWADADRACQRRFITPR
jgi:hypothetical protein